MLATINSMVKKVKFFKYIVFGLFLTIIPSGYSQVLINEICSSNSTVNPDEDGDYSDWIELYNSGVSTVNLFDYSITDDGTDLRKWTLPYYNLAAGAHVLIYASDKNRKSYVHHWETAIKDDDVWKYMVPSSEPSATWRDISYDDSAWPGGKGGFGYGDGDDSTIVTNPANSVFIRKTFTVTDKTKIAEAVLHIDYDDGYVAYLNGYPIGRSNMPSGFPPYNTDATLGREASMYGGGLPETKLINHDTLLLALVNGTNVLTIQVHNNNIASSDLTSRAFLSFGITDASILYNPTPAWFNISNTLPMHANFKLSDGEPVYLVNASGVAVDYKTPLSTKTDHSYGRKPDGSSTWVIFSAPTPGSTNNAATSYTSYCNSVLNFSVNAGFYSTSKTVAITGASQIRYTLDGSDPTTASPLYSTPININLTKVLRAACFTGGTIPFHAYTNTYFINEPTTLPVFSISTNPGYLFDPITGIYMLGPNADSVNLPHYGANYWEDWERPVHVEFFEKDRSQILDQDADIRIYGNWSRANDQKSLAIKASKKYGSGSFDHKFFPDKYINSFSQLVLRNSGGDNNVLQYRDGFIQKSVSDKTDLDIQDYRPSVVFINGQYWGILNIREKINSEYIESNHGVNKDKVDLGETWGQVLSGTNNIYVMQWLAKNLDMSVPANYHVVADSFDLDNMVDYFSTEIFISNWDWPQNNLKFWRPAEGDRKWRYILWDTDISYGLFNLQSYSFNQLGKLRSAPPLTIGPHSDIFVELLKNTAYRNKFVNRYADMMNMHFRTTKLDKLLYDMRDSISAEMPRHLARWAPWDNWPQEIQNVKDFYTNRLVYARNEVQNEFGLTKQVNVTLAVMPAGAGYIKINSIIPQTYPWTGVYFDGVPVEVTAVPGPGYTFNYWQSSTLIPSPNFNKKVSINVSTASETFTAHFTGSATAVKITVSEINYHSSGTADSDDWFELYNYGSAAADLSGWTLKDYFNEYIFPDNTIIAPGSRLVLCSDVTKFTTQYPGITNLGPIGLSLDNAGDLISLYDARGVQYLSFVYNDKAPWPTSPDGLGYTLESSGNTANPALSGSWFAGCLGGSPGYAYSASCVTAVEESSGTDAMISIYPNPARASINVEVKNNAHLKEWKLINNIGVELMQREINDNSYEEKIDLANLSPGLYTAVFYGDNVRVVRRIVVQ
jgi:hypothetical protein